FPTAMRRAGSWAAIRMGRGCRTARGSTWNWRGLVERRTLMAGTELKIVSNATCTFCGCVCDDMELTVEGNHITKAKNACVLGKAWFLNHHVEDRPVALIDGRPATLEAAVDRAARILAGAPYPIVYRLS